MKAPTRYLLLGAGLVVVLALAFGLGLLLAREGAPVARDIIRYGPVYADSLTATDATIGGGYGSTGCTVSSAGALSCNGNGIIGGTLTVTGTSDLVGNVADSGGTFTVADDASVTGALGVTGATTLANDLAVSPNVSGGNAGQRNDISGLVREKLVALGTMTNGTTETVSYTDDSPDGEWTAISTTVTISADTSIYRIGAKSLKLAFAATAVNDNGAVTDITNDDLSSNESIGFWIYSDTALDAGDLDVLIDDTDAAPDSSFDVCAVATPNVWQWCEVNIGALDGTTGNVVDKVGFVLKDAAGLGAFNVYIDGMWKWDADDEEALGTAILTDGVYSVMAIPTGETAANTPTVPVENTDYFVHYENGVDFLVTVTDQSANSGVALIGY